MGGDHRGREGKGAIVYFRESLAKSTAHDSEPLAVCSRIVCRKCLGGQLSQQQCENQQSLLAPKRTNWRVWLPKLVMISALGLRNIQLFSMYDLPILSIRLNLHTANLMVSLSCNHFQVRSQPDR